MDESPYSDVLNLHRRQRRCCRPGVLIALLGLLTALLWAGLLTLLLLWRWDTVQGLKQLEDTAALNVSQVSKDLERHKGDQIAQRSQEAQVLQTVEEVQAEQRRMKTQDSELSRDLDALREDLTNLKSQGLNERRTALTSLERLQEEVSKLWMELRVSNARTPKVTPGEMLPPTLLTVPLVRTVMSTAALATAPATAPALVSTTAPATAPALVSAPAPATAPALVSSPAPATVPALVSAPAVPLSLSSTPGSMCNTCPEEWISFQRKCYYFGEGAKRWIQARYACNKLNGRLVSIHNQEEQDFLAKYVNKKGSWIGLRDLDIEGEFVWMDGSPLDYSNWRPGEPNNGGEGEDCVMMLGLGQWNDAFCNSHLEGWICDRLAMC
ncbi:low affinity immunoglobulin epsilon Fc receptor isoform X2 [Desmodus rotundus]|uniref:low affinity immunoglobulin epsilon Fc receptor isoform X2 n=1 Tax=Desmodus rotundus TaxID=9430 RepID=UPI0023815200|nr:low affinity immunoglobulin epsilon Fc receptor isoform X2 [Desmodus rotundus]XP_045044183.2 low affinity immunoglobulin epsilon Fc receptor isoform X2 [Desmodus rotundus]